ncbi:GntR family transcriptional regulator [Roseospira marina]|uniref:GntR family transcriptional regulator n=1 Tax=Roseospira marina TaxID=140057 RepID=A0A5M6IF95_9PROT|nr:GntR family transcriptional regulator [Roseospira marina]KAA5606607.1 GntR family transcriptional regulator [Roseospira marina]MBB4313991.1 DNA-binding GntR family transcriptional regulator [Roseospira marina]MBB5087153.1 DNA-binding GntR family transcriptional regulator [Roseospira marina]
MRNDSKNAGIPENWVRPIAKENLSDQAYMELRGALMRGQLKPGERLRLRPMSARFGISPTPMREALLRLVFERALVLDARGTVTVPHLTAEQLLEIRAIRVDLEGNTAAAAAGRATPQAIDALEQIHARITDCHETGAFDQAIDLNTQFHLELCKLGNLPITYDLVENLWVRCGPILSHLYDAGVPAHWSPHPHRRILKALRDRDDTAARDGIRQDILEGGTGLLDHVRQG